MISLCFAGSCKKIYSEGFAGGKLSECLSNLFFLLSRPVQETQGDLNPGTGATEGAEETEGDRRRGCGLQNSVNSDCGSEGINSALNLKQNLTASCSSHM